MIKNVTHITVTYTGTITQYNTVPGSPYTTLTFQFDVVEKCFDVVVRDNPVVCMSGMCPGLGVVVTRVILLDANHSPLLIITNFIIFNACLYYAS